MGILYNKIYSIGTEINRMIKMENNWCIAKGRVIEIMAEYAFIIGTLAQQLERQGTKDAKEKIRRSVEYGLLNFEKMVQK